MALDLGWSDWDLVWKERFEVEGRGREEALRREMEALGEEGRMRDPPPPPPDLKEAATGVDRASIRGE